MAGLVAVCLLAVLWTAIRWEGQRHPHPMPMRWEQFFLDNPLRRKWFGPDRVLAVMGDLRGCRIGEIGVGVGVVMEAFAEAVGPEGQVWGIDIQPEAVRAAGERLKRRQLDERCRLETANAPQLPWAKESLDWVAMVSVIGEIPNQHRETTLRVAAHTLKPSGKLVITEYWPDPHYQEAPTLRRLLTSAGYQVIDYRRWGLVYTMVASSNLVDRASAQS